MAGYQDGDVYSTIYATVYAIGIIAVSIAAFLSLLSENDENLTTMRKLKRWFSLFRSKKSMYFEALIHLLDTATDIGVLIDWYQIGSKKNININNTSADDNYSYSDNFIDVMVLFWLSLFVKLSYHFVSSGYIWYLTRSLRKTIFQFLDIALFEMVFLNWKWNLSDACEPQKFIHKLEATFESFGQALLQFVYLCYTYNNNDIIYGNSYESPFVIISFVFSIISMSMRFITDDTPFFDDQAQESHFDIDILDIASCKIKISLSKS